MRLMSMNVSKMGPIAKKLAACVVLEAIILATLNTQVCIGGSKILTERDASDSCHLREFEFATVGLVSIFQNPNGLPLKAVEVKRQCEFINESIEGIEKYGRNCLSEMQVGLTHLIMGDAMKVAQEFCRPDSELRANYSKHAGCFRDVQRKFQRPCMTDFQVGFETIHKMNLSDRIMTSCCNINRLRECILVPIEEECGPAASSVVESIQINVIGTWWSLPCRDYISDNPDCQRLLPKVGTKPYNGRNVSALSRLISGFTAVPLRM